ncbi:NfeD family protein [Pseudogemmobacter sonorensis]|uniref:NfeD family protein n=1 Tax=Pseudogemmobacter sonorensis TaxID=2989681 RepID=UPI0036B81646
MEDPVWTVWWAWIAGGVGLGIVEVFAPGFFFLGFAVGAVLTGVLIGIGALGWAGLPFILMVFALLSLVAWWALRRWFARNHPSEVKVWDRDINDN